jgi:glutamate synthase (NADPH/NADH) small chain
MPIAHPAPRLASVSSAVFTELHPPLSARDALLEADRCLACGGRAGAPCVSGCPAGVDVPAFIAAIAEDRPDTAARLIFEANLLGGSCARVCPVEELCARDCVLLHEGRPAIDIGGLQRYATDWAFRNNVAIRPRRATTGKHVAVIGAGPAGLAAAGELGALGHDVTVYDRRPQAGGLLRYAIAPYRQLNEPLPEEIRSLGQLGVRFRFATDIDEPFLRMLEYTADAIILAIGMGGDVEVEVPGSDLLGVWNSLPFIEQLKTGAPPDVSEHVVVVGGGNTAVDCAVEARRLGADVVTMLYRRTRAEMPAYAAEVELAEREGVSFEWLAAPVRFVGSTRVAGVECRRMELGEPDASGRRRPHEVPGSEYVLPAETVIMAIGQHPHAEFIALIDGIELDGNAIAVDELGRTGNPTYFAAGDAVNGGATVVEAVRGAKAVAHAVEEALA